MTKKEKLEKLDGLLIDKLITIMGTNDTSQLSDLATVSNYLAKNNKVEEKEKSSLEDDIKKKVKDAKDRRDNGEV